MRGARLVIVASTGATRAGCAKVFSTVPRKPSALAEQWRVRLLPGAHPAVDEQHLAVDMDGGV
ncbi:MAG: hypothetical protein ACR2LU_11200, partial [Luteitalea sp.]